jgi:hypothetical protein
MTYHRMFLIGCGAMLIAALPANLAISQPQEEAGPILKGIVRGPSGKPVAMATVWLVARRGDAFDAPLKTQTDASGFFSFADLDEAKLFAPGSDVTVAARDAEGRLGWRNLSHATREQALCELRLRAAASLSGRVLNAEGRALGGARLTAKSFTEPRGPGVPLIADETVVLWPALAEEFSVQTGVDGSFQVSPVPRAVQARYALAAGEAKVELVIESGIAATIRLGKPGGIAGRLALPEGVQLPLKSFELQAWLQPNPSRPEEPSLQFTGLAAADEEGRFSFAGLPPGRYVIRPVVQQNAPFFVAASPPLEVQSGQRLDSVELPVTPRREVRGRLVDGETGLGIQGVEVNVYTSDPVAGQREGRTVTTDAEGRYSTWLLPGTVQTFLRQIPVEYLAPPFDALNTRFLPTLLSSATTATLRSSSWSGRRRSKASSSMRQAMPCP